MTKHDLKELAAMGAELGAAKAENDRLREVLSRIANLPMYQCSTENDYRLSAAKAMAVGALTHQADPAETTEAYTARDMATAAAQGFRDGQGVMELVGYQFQGRNGEWNSFMDQRHYENTRADGTWQIRAIYTPASEQQGKFRMGDLVKKSTGSEWEGRVVGWYSTEQTPEGYAVESSAKQNRVQM
jgi:hypothetical protein